MGLTGVQPPHSKFRGGYDPPNPPLFGALTHSTGELGYHNNNPAYGHYYTRIGNIEKSINEQKLLGTSTDKSESGVSDSNELIDVDQNVLNANLNRDENKNKHPTGTVPQSTGTQTDGIKTLVRKIVNST